MAETLGSRLRAAMKKAGMKNYELAEAAGVHTITISKWREDKQIPEAEALDRAAAALGVSPGWLRYGEEAPEGYASRLSGSRGPSMVRETPPAAMPEDYPQKVRAMIRAFETEATEQGATEWEIDFCRAVLISPAASVMYQGGRPRQLTEEEWLTEVSALIVGLRAWLKERIKRRQAGTA